MDNQKGQSTVEFAFVLPLFLMIMFAAIYGGMMFYDFWHVKSVTENMARNAMLKVENNVLSDTAEENIKKVAKDDLKNKYGKLELTAYKVKEETITVKLDNDVITATINLEKKDDIPSIVSSLLPEEMPFESTMPVINSQ